MGDEESERGGRPHDRRSGGYCRNYELPRVAGGTISPGYTSSEARMERYDVDVSPGTGDERVIPGVNFSSIRKGSAPEFGSYTT